MEIKGGAFARFLEGLDGIDAVLVYGPDRGLVEERRRQLTAAVVEDADDPFRVAALEGAALRADPARIRDEAAALAFGGGRRLVLVSGAGNDLSDIFEDFFKQTASAGLVVATAGELTKSSRLRKLFEKAKRAAAVPCYHDDDAALEGLIRSVLGQYEQRAEAAAMAYLLANLGGDRGLSRGELEKLALYVGQPGAVSLAQAEACVGDGAAHVIDDVVMAAGAGDFAALDLSLERSFGSGQSPVSILRAAARHFQRLALAADQLKNGSDVNQALQSLKPAVFWKLRDAFVWQLRNWPTPRLAQALEIITEAELHCKSTASPDRAVCSRALMRIAQGAREKKRSVGKSR
ncbi:MAG: DNA polymerase III subunit delta [Alphaproteobacteria bacterium]|jgi:DNA polymerase-3 subunit delta|nr:DNA polymerase III subunit delta [Alphaproteobacteria bacterium]